MALHGAERINLTDTQIQLVESTMRVVATRGWSGSNFVDFAQEAGLSFGEACIAAKDKWQIIDLFSRMIDQRLLGEVDVDQDEPARDRLFDVCMDRFELLKPYHGGLKALKHDLHRDPRVAAQIWANTSNSIAHMLDLAQIRLQPLVAPVKIQAFLALYMKVVDTFLRDESEDLAATMKSLDKQLERAEIWANDFAGLFEREKGGWAGGAASSSEADGEPLGEGKRWAESAASTFANRMKQAVSRVQERTETRKAQQADDGTNWGKQPSRANPAEGATDNAPVIDG